MERESETTSIEEIKQKVIDAACRWHSADIYVHPVLDRAQAVKVGCADLIDAVQDYKNAMAPSQVASNEN